MNKESNNAQLKGQITRYVVNNHQIKVSHSEFYWLSGKDGLAGKWFLNCSYKGQPFSTIISAEPSITVDMVKDAMEKIINEIVESVTKPKSDLKAKEFDKEEAPTEIYRG